MNNFLLYNIEHQFSFLLSQLENLDDNQFKKRPIPSKWSVHEHLAHLGRYQEIFLARLEVILQEDDPPLNRYVADKDDGFIKWCKLSTSEIINQATNKRKIIFDLLNSLTSAQLNQIGIHSKLGRMNIEDWVNFFLLHESHHIYSIFGLKHRFHLNKNA